ncbi:protein kinase [Neorhodopirellula lusitana]|uniref:protein kinase n=1 Tax=Neorhodopirellula lusitana TaxID=445327 RepID=UPI00384B0C74
MGQRSMRVRVRVLKIGGSLLERPTLLDDLAKWNGEAKWNGDGEIVPDVTIAIVGGGQMIEAMRCWDRLRPGDPVEVHWRCIEMLRFSFEAIRDAMRSHPGWKGFESIETAEHWNRFLGSLHADGLQTGGLQTGGLQTRGKRFVLLSVPAAYHRQLSGASSESLPLPEDWRTTSDAIAIGLANQMRELSRSWAASRSLSVQCVLLKSCEVPPEWSLASLVQAGIVDPACGDFADSGINLDVCSLPLTGAIN